VDVWGPTKTASLEGHRYFVSIVDNYSRRYWVYPMRQRVETLELLVKGKEQMENQTDRKIKVLRYGHVEAIEYASHLLNRLPMTAIGGKTPLDIWSGGAARVHGSLRVFGCPAYVYIKKDMLNSKVNKLVFLGYKEDLKGYKLWDPKNREFISSRHVTLNEAS